MMLKKNLAIIILAILLIVACQLVGSQKPSTDIPKTTEGYPPPVKPVYPESTYPSSSQPSTDLSNYPEPSVSTSLYPDAKDGDEVPWSNAVAIILNGEVTQVMQTHDLKVSLSLKDGRTLMTIEPNIDDMIKVIEECGENCKYIRIATE